MLWRYLRTSFAFRFALIAAVFGLVPAALAVFEAVRTRRRLQDFFPARAEILEQRVHGGRGGPSYSFRVRYLDTTRLSHECWVTASKSEYFRYGPKDEVRLYVSGVNPDDAWLVSSGKPDYTRTILSAAAAAILILPVAPVFLWLRGRVAVLRYGQCTVGRVEKVRRDSRVRFSTKHEYVLLFSYTGPDGRTRRKRSLHFSKKLADHWKSRPTIPVYFDASNPGRAEADVFGLREARQSAARVPPAK